MIRQCSSGTLRSESISTEEVSLIHRILRLLRSVTTMSGPSGNGRPAERLKWYGRAIPICLSCISHSIGPFLTVPARPMAMRPFIFGSAKILRASFGLFTSISSIADPFPGHNQSVNSSAAAGGTILALSRRRHGLMPIVSSYRCATRCCQIEGLPFPRRLSFVAPGTQNLAT